MVKLYCEVIDEAMAPFKWRIVAEDDELGKYIGEWEQSYSSFATLKAPTGENRRMQTWIAGSSYWSSAGNTIGGFPEFTPISLGDCIGAEPINIDIAVHAASLLSNAALVEAAKNGAELGTCDED